MSYRMDKHKKTKMVIIYTPVAPKQRLCEASIFLCAYVVQTILICK